MSGREIQHNKKREQGLLENKTKNNNNKIKFTPRHPKVTKTKISKNQKLSVTETELNKLYRDLAMSVIHETMLQQRSLEVLWQDTGGGVWEQTCVCCTVVTVTEAEAEAGDGGGGGGGVRRGLRRWPRPPVARRPPAGCRRPGSVTASAGGATAAWPCSCAAPEPGPTATPQSCSTFL